MEHTLPTPEDHEAQSARLAETITFIKDIFGEDAEFTREDRSGNRATLTIDATAIICGMYFVDEPNEELLPVLQDMYEKAEMMKRVIAESDDPALVARAQELLEESRQNGAEALARYQ